jgi:exosome complex RNA-binding protein Rrp4
MDILEMKKLRDIVGAKVILQRQFVLGVEDSDYTLLRINATLHNVLETLKPQIETFLNPEDMLAAVVHIVLEDASISPETALNQARAKILALADRLSKIRT